MTSEQGFFGPEVGRCYPFWHDFLKCMYECDTQEQRILHCDAFRSDYFECLHGFKTETRWNEVYKVKKMKQRGEWDPSRYQNPLAEVDAMDKLYEEYKERGREYERSKAEKAEKAAAAAPSKSS